MIFLKAILIGVFAVGLTLVAGCLLPTASAHDSDLCSIIEHRAEIIETYRKFFPETDEIGRQIIADNIWRLELEQESTRQQLSSENQCNEG